MNFANLLDRDLKRLGLTQQAFIAKLTEPGEVPLSESALSNWKAKGSIPKGRLAKVLAVLGEGSEVQSAVLNNSLVRPAKRELPMSDSSKMTTLQLAAMEALVAAMRAKRFSDSDCLELLNRCIEK